MQIIALIVQKDGVGKTACAINIRGNKRGSGLAMTHLFNNKQS